MTHAVRIRWSRIAIVTALVLLSGAVVEYFRLLPPATSFDRQVVTPRPQFKYANSLTCTVVYSTHKAGLGLALPWLETSSFTIAGLETDRPAVLSSYSTRTEALRKVYEDADYVTLEYAAQQWNTVTIGISKTAGTFVAAMTGIQAGDARFQYAVAAKGTCE